MTRYLLDTTVLIGYLRDDARAVAFVLGRFSEGDDLCTSCVTIVEVERGSRPGGRKAAGALLDRLAFLPTTKEAAFHAGRYQADWRRRGKTIHLADALIAGTARAHGAVLVTDNLADLPMRDIRVRAPDRARA